MTFKDLKLLRFNNFYTPEKGLPILLPFVGYIVFGVLNIVFFSTATKHIPIPTAFAVWMAGALALIKLSDVIFFKQNTSFPEAIFLIFIAVGILGLKFYSTSPK